MTQPNRDMKIAAVIRDACGDACVQTREDKNEGWNEACDHCELNIKDIDLAAIIAAIPVEVSSVEEIGDWLVKWVLGSQFTNEDHAFAKAYGPDKNQMNAAWYLAGWRGKEASLQTSVGLEKEE